MADFEHARAMLRMAHKDFNALTGMLDSALFADEIFGFHVQQAIEKGLKAWLCTRGADYPPTHDLARLLTLLEKNRRGCGTILAAGSVHHLCGSGTLRGWSCRSG